MTPPISNLRTNPTLLIDPALEYSQIHAYLWRHFKTLSRQLVILASTQQHLKSGQEMFHRNKTTRFLGFLVGGGCADVGADFVGTDSVEVDAFFEQDFAEGADEADDCADADEC